MWNNIWSAIKKMDPIIIFGCTELGKEICADIKSISNEAVLFFFDNDIMKQGRRYSDILVLKKDELQEKLQSSCFIITSINAFKEMEEQLISLGVQEDRIILPEAVLNHKIEVLERKVHTYEQVIAKRTPKKELGFIVDLAEHCNLNCQCCDHFSPLAEPYFTNIEEFQKDLKRMKEIFGDRITSVSLEGGEPLLNSKVEDYIYISREIFPLTKIFIFTNGILLTKKSDEFWDACRKCGVILEVTKYPIDFNYDKIEKQVKQKGVELRYFSGGDVEKTTIYKPLDIDGKQDKYYNYHHCWNANSDCIMLKKGKLYTCTRIPNIETFNRYFHKNIEVTDKDYIDIYSDITSEEIFEFLSNPMPVCRYCRVKDWTEGYKWGVTKRSIKEWA